MIARCRMSLAVRLLLEQEERKDDDGVEGWTAWAWVKEAPLVGALSTGTFQGFQGRTFGGMEGQEVHSCDKCFPSKRSKPDS